MRMAALGMPITGGFGLIVVLVIAALPGVNPLSFLGGGDAGPPVNQAPTGRRPHARLRNRDPRQHRGDMGERFPSSGQNYREPRW